MRALLPEPADSIDIHDAYAPDWLYAGGLRVNFIASVDGAVSVAGRSRGLQTDGDNRVFAALRDLADVVLVGSGTAVTEGYKAVQLSADRQRIRRRFGLAPELPVAVVSRSLRLDPASPLFAPGTLVLTCTAADPDRRARLAEVAEVIDCGDEEVDLNRSRDALQERGHRRILCEGGPTLFSTAVAARAVDELCLTVSPLLAGPGPGRIIAGLAWPEPPGPLRLTALLEEDGALFGRYALADPPQ